MFHDVFCPMWNKREAKGDRIPPDVMGLMCELFFEIGRLMKDADVTRGRPSS